jgi:hypothetical protein
MAVRVFIAENEEPLRLLLRYNLEAEGYGVDCDDKPSGAGSCSCEGRPCRPTPQQAGASDARLLESSRLRLFSSLVSVHKRAVLPSV